MTAISPSSICRNLLRPLLVALPILSAAAASAGDDSPQKPNVLIILADDLGYGDVQCYNPQRGKISTPNIDRLAAEGMRFTDGHSSSGVCSPSRYTLLTGRYHWRTRLQSGIVGVFGKPLLAPDRLTIAGLAQQHGYCTAAIGKWHLGWDWPIEPESQRFFTGLGGQAGGGGQVKTEVNEEHRAAWSRVFSQPIPGGPTTRGFDRYFGTDVPNWPPYCFLENDRTLGMPSTLLPAELLRQHQASLQGPAMADWKLEPILPTLGDQAASFIREQAAAKQPFLLYLPLTSPHTPLAVNEMWRGRSGLNAFADFVMETDAVVGRVLDALRESGAAENTLVLFTADNGCAPYIGAKDLEAKGHFPSGPLRGYKADVWEGGHRVPFIVRWPGQVKAGSVCDQLVHHADAIATLAEILGAKLPDNAGEDSFSLGPLLAGGEKPVREHAVSCSSSGIQGLRRSHWKLICHRQPQLYNLAADLGETRDLAAEKPELVAELVALRERLITAGRSTPGSEQANDVEVRRYVEPVSPAKPKAKAARPKAKPGAN